jgi:hypothetical protein
MKQMKPLYYSLSWELKQWLINSTSKIISISSSPKKGLLGRDVFRPSNCTAGRSPWPHHPVPTLFSTARNYGPCIWNQMCATVVLCYPCRWKRCDLLSLFEGAQSCVYISKVYKSWLTGGLRPKWLHTPWNRTELYSTNEQNPSRGIVLFLGDGDV